MKPTRKYGKRRDRARDISSAFVTGAAGFVGGHLAASLSAEGSAVWGYDLRPPECKLDGFYEGDISDEAELREAFRETQPDVIFHLAGTLKAERSALFYESYVTGTVSLFEGIVSSGLKPLVIIAGSSAIYGAGAGPKPITEGMSPKPLTHYAVSKAAQELVALRYALAHDLPVIRVRSFNLLGPGLSPQMACSSFARQIALAERSGGKGEIRLGNLDGRRDFVDVRDAACAFTRIAQSGKAGAVYNVCSERAVSTKHCLDLLLGMTSARLDVRMDSQGMTEHDVPIQVGSARRLKQDTGWRARIGLKQSLQDLLSYWRARAELERVHS